MNILKIITIIGLILCFNCLRANEGQDESIIREINIVAGQGEKEFQEFVWKNKERITPKVIREMAKKGLAEREKIFIDMAIFAAEQKGDEENLADVYIDLGKYLYFTGKYKDARDIYMKALSLYEEFNDQPGQGKAYSGLGDVYFKFGENPESLEMYNKALTYLTGINDLSGEGDVYWGMGNVYFYTGKLDDSMKSYKKALGLYKKNKDWPGLGKVYRTMGDYYAGIADVKKSFKLYKKALKFSKKAGDSLEQGHAYRGIGGHYVRMNNIAKAIQSYEKALGLFKEAKSPMHQGNLYWSLGNIYRDDGNYKEALEIFHKALDFFLEIEDPRGLGNTYWCMAVISKANGAYGKALELYEKTLALFEKIGDPRGMGNTYCSMGELFLRMGYSEKAVEMFRKALPLYIKTGNIFEQAKVYQHMGDFYFKISDEEKALKMYNKALNLFKKKDVSLGLGNVYTRIGDLFLSKKNHSKALEMYSKASYKYGASGIMHGVGNTYLARGETYFQLNNDAKALSMYEKALDIFKKIGVIESEAAALYGKAEIFKKLAQEKEALKLYEDAISRLERVRSQIYFSEMKKYYLEKVINKYENAVLFMLENHFDYKAFYYTEAMKARAFLDQLAEGLVKLEKGIEPGLKREQDILVNRLSILNSQLLNETRGTGEKTKFDSLKKELKKVEEKLDNIKREIRIKNPLYASVRYPQPVTVSQLQKKVLRKNEVILEYFVSARDVYCFFIGTNNFMVKKLEMPKNVLENKVKTFRERMENYQSPDRIIRKEMQQLACQLYESLVGPFVVSLNGNQTIIIIPDGILALLPFEALEVRQGKDIHFLAEQYRIKYIQSASILNILRTHYKQAAQCGFIGFGDPVYDDKSEAKAAHKMAAADSHRVKLFREQLERDGSSLTRLEQSGKEVTEIGEIFKAGKNKIKTLLGSEAREEAAKYDRLINYDFIHFSAHSILDDAFQAIVLSQIPGTPEDGFLTIEEIMNSRYDARLVVLSACNTGMGKIERGEGVRGLTRAVMYAGSPAVLVSLLRVDDLGTKELMIRFYRNLIDNKQTVEEALRNAKIDMIKNKDHSHPYFWAPFILYGE